MISIVTITCRRDPGFHRMAEALVASAEKANRDVQWVIVDHFFSDRPYEFEHPKIPICHLPPRLSSIFPNPNAARNTGLAAVQGGYTYFLDDHCIVSPSLVSRLAHYDEQGWGFRTFVRYKEADCVEDPAWEPEALSPTQCNGLMGAPTPWFFFIGGFDEEYAGEMKWEDIDAVARMQRGGLEFYGDRQSYVWHQEHEPCSTDPIVNNKALYKRLIEDDVTRIQPVTGPVDFHDIRVEIFERLADTIEWCPDGCDEVMA